MVCMTETIGKSVELLQISSSLLSLVIFIYECCYAMNSESTWPHTKLMGLIVFIAGAPMQRGCSSTWFG
jgi:hypothetical protein